MICFPDMHVMRFFLHLTHRLCVYPFDIIRSIHRFCGAGIKRCAVHRQRYAVLWYTNTDTFV